MARRDLLEGTRSNGLLYVQAAQRLGLRPITLSADPAQYDYLVAESVEAIRVDTDNLEALIRECSLVAATCDITGITTSYESFCATVGKLCRRFGLPGPNPASIEQCCDKLSQHQILAQAGVPIPDYRLVTDVADVKGAAAEIGLPVVLKPAVGSGSSGVRLCRDVDELVEHSTYLLGGQHLWASSRRILVEEFAQGPLYWATMMGDEVIGIEASEFGPLPHFVYRGGIFPAPLANDQHERMADVSLSCLRALGLGWGPTHVEFRWTKRGPVVIEVNPRLGAGPLVVQLAYGIDLITEHIKLVVGDEWDLPRRNSHIAAWRGLLPDRDGTLDWIDGDSQAAAISGVAQVRLYVRPKMPIVRKGDYRDSMGTVIAVSPHLAQTKAILQRAVDLIDWSITPFPTIGEQ
ncbi:acetyl-CoA carboxylase biotin carboxylase subunit family protein [Mesorhizobium ciceri]|uniref:ATP-grasp domain-containing protein n=1 Tax=Mesorhizobium TaxID=68287 RepID=UPI0007A95949|nr:acetyl-CoA carboxylase biotin carboxylase subunit family protein [Mesorhizobium ciceri]AMY03400.1 hypothetical protein A4R29_05055 [Mesorhizobium ciceri biovar biserrulae]